MSRALYPAFRLNRQSFSSPARRWPSRPPRSAPEGARRRPSRARRPLSRDCHLFPFHAGRRNGHRRDRPRATINWAPNESRAAGTSFLARGNTATYQGAAGLTGYTVLNRILPSDVTRAIELKARVLGKLTAARRAATSGSTAPAGSHRLQRRVRCRRTPAQQHRPSERLSTTGNVHGVILEIGAVPPAASRSCPARRSMRSATATSRWSPRGSSRAAMSRSTARRLMRPANRHHDLQPGPVRHRGTDRRRNGGCERHRPHRERPAAPRMRAFPTITPSTWSPCRRTRR